MAIPYLLMGNIGEEGTHLRHDADHFDRLRHPGASAARAQAVDAGQAR